MGYYIDTGGIKGKVAVLVKDHGALVITEHAARAAVKVGIIGVVVVVDNGPFEAAGYCYSPEEFEAFHTPGEQRPRTYLFMDKGLAEKLSGYRG